MVEEGGGELLVVAGGRVTAGIVSPLAQSSQSTYIFHHLLEMTLVKEKLDNRVLHLIVKI